jgi:hypothetical protein
MRSVFRMAFSTVLYAGIPAAGFDLCLHAVSGYQYQAAMYSTCVHSIERVRSGCGSVTAVLQREPDSQQRSLVVVDY